MVNISMYLRAGIIAAAVYFLINAIALFSARMYKIQDEDTYLNGVSTPVKDTDLASILAMYEANPSMDFLESRLSQGAVFDDPFMIGQGSVEIFNTFKGLRFLYPRIHHFYIISPSKVYLDMKYTLLVYEIELSSILYIEHDENSKIRLIKEQWNDMPLYTSTLFRTIRRFNGMLVAFLFS